MGRRRDERWLRCAGREGTASSGGQWSRTKDPKPNPSNSFPLLHPEFKLHLLLPDITTVPYPVSPPLRS